MDWIELFTHRTCYSRFIGCIYSPVSNIEKDVFILMLEFVFNEI